MAKQKNQKSKLLYLVQVLFENTDEEHGISVEQIQKYLKLYGIDAERRSIYSDIRELQDFGIDIIINKVKNKNYYQVCSREFELPELKLLIDAVQVSKFITQKKSNELIKKLENLTSKYEALKLDRQVLVEGRVKNENETIYYSVDKIHTAIGMNVKIEFQYFKWSVNKERELKKEGRYYIVSPYALIWQNENYYLIGYDDEENIIKHYRVDKMLNMKITNNKRNDKRKMEEYDIASYSKKMFGMYNGNEITVKMELKNELAGVVIDRFGKEVSMVPKDENYFIVTTKVAVSNQFFGWVLSLGEDAKVIYPNKVVNDMRKYISNVCKNYNI